MQPGTNIHGEEPNFRTAVLGFNLIIEQYPELKDPIIDLLTEAAGKEAWNNYVMDRLKEIEKERMQTRRQKKKKPIVMTREQYDMG